MSISKSILKFRNQKGFSQEKLANESGISLRTIQRIESGSSKPTGFTLNAIAKGLETTIETLVEDSHSEIDFLERISWINISGLFGMILPFGNFIFPFLQWRKYRFHSEINEVGKRILNFQLFWTIAASLCFLIVPMIQYATIQYFGVGKGPITWIVFLVLVIINIGFTLKSAKQLKRGDYAIHQWVPQWF